MNEFTLGTTIENTALDMIGRSQPEAAVILSKLFDELNQFFVKRSGDRAVSASISLKLMLACAARWHEIDSSARLNNSMGGLQ
jgi:hypothetical protein